MSQVGRQQASAPADRSRPARPRCRLGVTCRVSACRAAWPSGLGKGLQSPVQRFDSARRLGPPGQLNCWSGAISGQPGTQRQRPPMTPGNQHFAPRSRLNRVSGVRRFAVVGYIRKQRRKYRARYRDPLGRVTFDQGWDIPRSTSRLTGTAICSPSSMRPLRRRSASGLQMPAPIGARPSSTPRLAERDSRGCTLNQSCRRGSCVEGWFRSDPNKVARSHLDETQDGCASGGAVIWATEVLDQLARTGHPSSRGHRCGHGTTSRMRHAQQGTPRRCCHRRTRRHTPTHVRTSAQEDAATALSAQLEPHHLIQSTPDPKGPGRP